MKKILFVLAMALAVASCAPESEWSDPSKWYKSTKKFNEGYADVFYLVSTNILSERDSAGNVLYRALNTPQEKEILAREMRHIETKTFADSLNFFAPYYHQHTLESINLDSLQYAEIVKEISLEVSDAFDYYLKYLNGGRPVILAGFSQGALLTKELLKMLTTCECKKIVASYVLGWGLNEQDVACQNIVPAKGADDTCVCISFNTVADTSAIWYTIMDNASYSINPVTWTTDAASSEFIYGDQNLTVHLDTTRMVLDVDNFEEMALPFQPVWPKGCLHFYEIQFYNPYLNANALQRVNNFRKALH